MSLAVVLGCVWVSAAAVAAMLLMRRRYVPEIALLLAVPTPIFWIDLTYGWLRTAVGRFALISMFRNPFRCYSKRALGHTVELSAELRELAR